MSETKKFNVRVTWVEEYYSSVVVEAADEDEAKRLVEATANLDEDSDWRDEHEALIHELDERILANRERDADDGIIEVLSVEEVTP